MANGNGAMNAQRALVDQNAAMRQMLLATGVRAKKKLVSVTDGALGGASRIKLFNVGLTTGVWLRITSSITIGTATATQSPRGPFNLINRLTLTDYAGNDRVNLSGFQLYLLNSLRNRAPFGFDQLAANAGHAAAGNSEPNVPTAVATATLSFWLYVPLAYNPETDLRGILVSQTASGEAYITINWNSLYYTNANCDYPYDGAATTTVVQATSTFINVDAWQEYILPQNVGGGLPIPQLDVMTVYELAGAYKSSDNLAAGSEKLVNFPNNRSILSATMTYVDAGDMTGSADCTSSRIIVNGNNIVRDDTYTSKIIEQRNIFGGDIGPNILFYEFRSKPIETALWGNVQLGFVPAATSGNTYVDVLWEGFYQLGAPLPAVQGV